LHGFPDYQNCRVNQPVTRRYKIIKWQSRLPLRPDIAHCRQAALACLHLWNDGGERVPVIRIARQRCDVSDKLPAGFTVVTTLTLTPNS
jgi:hypothetical protein